MLGIFLDIETNGLDPFIHIPLEIGLKIVNLKNGALFAEYQQVLASGDQEWNTFDKQSLEINGISHREMNEGISKEKVATEIKNLFALHGIQRGKAFFICQNPSFDRPFFAKIIPPYEQEKLGWPYHWLDLASMFWALRLVKEQKTHEFDLIVSKDAIAMKLQIAPEARPHRAMNGVDHLLSCYTSLVQFPCK